MPLLTTIASGSARGFGFDLAIEEDQEEGVTGVSAAASVSAVSVLAGTLVGVSGVSSTGSIGSATAQGSSDTVSISGVAGTTGLGSVSTAAGARTTVQGVGATSALGTATASITKTAAIVDVTGVSASSAVGSATVNIPFTGVIVYPTGVSSTASVGSVTATVPPASQYFATRYFYTGSTNSETRDVQVWQWNPSTNSVTKVGGPDSGGLSSSMTTAARDGLGGNILAAPTVANSSGQWLVYGTSGGTTNTVIDLYRYSSTTGALVVSRSTAYTEISPAGTTYSWGYGLSIGYTNQRLAYAWTGSTTNSNVPRVFSLNIDGATASSTITLISPINAPSTSTSYRYRSASVHPTQNTVVFAANQTNSPYNNGRLYLYTNYGQSGSETQTLYTVTGTSENSPTSYGFASVWSRDGSYLVVADGRRTASGVVGDARLYFYSFDGSALSLLQTLDLPFRDPKIVWGPADAYLLASGEGDLQTITRLGNNFSLGSSYPNANQNRQLALNYNASALFGPTDYPSDNTNMRVFLMDPSNDGDVQTLAVSQTVSMSGDPSGFAHYYGTVALPPLED
jgi:hypothetical protein